MRCTSNVWQTKGGLARQAGVPKNRPSHSLSGRPMTGAHLPYNLHGGSLHSTTGKKMALYSHRLRDQIHSHLPISFRMKGAHFPYNCYGGSLHAKTQGPVAHAVTVGTPTKSSGRFYARTFGLSHELLNLGSVTNTVRKGDGVIFKMMSFYVFCHAFSMRPTLVRNNHSSLRTSRGVTLVIILIITTSQIHN